MRDVIYGIVDGTVVFAERRIVDDLLAVRSSIGRSKTWGEFLHALPPHIRADVKRRSDEHFDDKRAFSAEDVPGYADGDWPAFPNQLMIELLPNSVMMMGAITTTVFNGDRLDIPESNAFAACAELRRLKWNLERDDSRISRAIGFEES